MVGPGDALASALADRYTFEAPLGEGGMATVWRVHDRRHDRAVALKVLRPELSEAIATERFLREVRVAASLQHPGILPLFDSGEANGVPWYVMPLVAGETLRQKLTRERQLSVEEAVRITRQVAAALAYAHQRDIVHRDVKPENILLADGQAYLADFGIALAMQRVDAERLTQSGFMLGTPQYLSPELAAGDMHVDGRSDQWALSAVLYEMLAGQPPHTGSTFQSLAARIVTEAPASLSALRPGVPAGLEAAVMRSLQKVPADRYADTATFEVALAGAMALAPSPVLPVAPWWTVTDPTRVRGLPAGAWRRARTWLGVLALCITVVALIGWFRDPVIAAPTGLPMRLSLEPPSGERFVSGLIEGGEALAPDGQTVAFVASSKGATRLWIRELSTRSDRVLTGTEGAAFPFWSPDGRSIGFFSGDKLMRVGVDGGAPIVICQAFVGRGAAWTDDGRIVFSGYGPLSIVSDAGGTPQILIIARDSGVVLRWPQVLPGGRLLYYAPRHRSANAGTYLTTLADPGTHVLVLENETEAVYTQDGRGHDFLTWIRNGSLVVAPLDVRNATLGAPQLVADSVHGFALTGRSTVTASRSGTLLYSSMANFTSQFGWFDRTGRELGTLGEPTQFNEFRLSPDGRQVVASRERPSGLELWTIDAERNVSTRIETGLSVSTFPVWMPDGRSLLFAGGDIRNLFRRDATGGQRQLTQSSMHQLPNDVCRDGRVALYYRITPKTQRDLWTLALDTSDATPRAYLATPSQEAFARFSPDCQWVAYQSDETGHHEVYVASYPDPSQRIRVSTTAGGGLYPVWAQRKTGALELLYLAPDGMIMSVPMTTANHSIQVGAAREVFRIRRVDDLSSPFDATADGERFLVRMLSPSAPLSVIVNWPALLK